MSNIIPVIKFLFTGEFRVLNETLNPQSGYTVEEFSAVNDLATYLSTEPAGLVIASLKDKNDLVQIATLLKTIKKVAKDTTLKIVVVNFSGDKQFEKATAKLGIQDVVEPAINGKALKFKLDFWMKSLNAQVKNNPNANSQKNVKTPEAAKANEKKVADTSTPVWLEPLELEDDIWLLKNDADCKKVLSKWLIRLLGPSPYVGQWKDVQANIWRFEIKENEKDMYVPGAGHWYFHGDAKPDFVWKENIWLISGDSFDLFYKDGPQVFSRLKCKDKSLSICKNSLFAKTKEQIIIESFDKELVFRKEAQSINDLEGKGKTDTLNGDPLSGKNKTSHLNHGPLSGEINPEDQLLSSDALTQKASNDKQSSFWQGKNTYDKDGADGKGPASEGVRAGSNLEQDRKNTEHQKYYKNHNEAEKYEAEKKEHERSLKQEGDQGGNLSGKSSTDQIESFYDNDKARKEQTTTENKERELSGKSETDKLKSHYENPRATIQTEVEKAEAAKKDIALVSAKEKNQTGKEGPQAGKDNSSDAHGKPASSATKSEESQLRQKEELAAKNKSKTEINLEEQNKTKTAMAGLAENQAAKGKLASLGNTSEYEMKGQSSTDSLSGHYKNPTAEKSEKKEKDKGNDPYEDLFGKGKDRKEVAGPAAKKAERKVEADYAQFDDDSFDDSEDGKQQKNADVISINKAKSDNATKTFADEVIDPDLADACADAKVVSIMSYKQKKISCNMDDFFDETIIFITNEDGISTSSKVDLNMSFQYLNKETELKFEGDVLTVEGDGEGNNYVTVQLAKADVQAFDKFIKLYNTRQENANSFLKKVKGL